MTRVPIALSALFALCAACSNTTGSSTGSATNGTTTGGNNNGTGGAYTFVAADTTDAGMAGLPIALAVGPNDRVGVAYFRPTGTFSLPLGDAGQRENFGVMYVELQNQAIKVPPAQIAVVQVQDGLTVGFNDQGQAVVGFVGGNAYFYDGGIPADAGPDTAGSLYWLQSQAALAYQQSDGGWDLQVCMQDSTAMGAFTWNVNGSSGLDQSAMQLINEGNVVGLWPSIVFDGGTTIMAYRDVHFGQFPVQDWAASDVKLCQGTPNNWTSWSAPMTIDIADDHKDTGYGLHTTMLFGKNGALAVVGDQDITGQGAVDREGINTWFVQQNLGSWTSSTTDWSLPINPFNPKNNVADTLTNTQTGPGMAYSAAFGYSVVAVDTSPPSGGGAAALYYASSPDGVTWTPRYTLYSNGSGGFYPAIADDPLTGFPNVVYTLCSAEPGQLPTAVVCSTPELDLAVISQNPPNLNVSVTTVTTESVFMPKIAFLSTDKVVIAYRNLKSGALFVAYQN